MIHRLGIGVNFAPLRFVDTRVLYLFELREEWRDAVAIQKETAVPLNEFI